MVQARRMRLVESFDSVRDLFPSESPCPCAGRGGESGSCGWVVGECVDGLGERGWIIRRYKPAIDAMGD